MTVQQTFATLGRATVPLIAAAIVADLAVDPALVGVYLAIGSVAGFEGTSLADCARAAYADLIARLERFHGFTRHEAYELLSAVGRLDVGNMIDPFYSALASVERRYL